MSDFTQPVIAGEYMTVPGLRSPNYIDPEHGTGFRVGGDGSAEFQNMNVNGTVAGDTADFDTLKQGGLTLDEIEAPFAQGLEAWKFNQTAGILNWAAAGEKIMETTCVLRPNRIYECTFSGCVLEGTVAGGIHLIYMTWTESVDAFTAPVPPTPAGTKVTSGAQRFNSPGTFAQNASLDGWISNLGSVPIQATVALCVIRIAGGGVPQTFFQDAFGARLAIKDGGMQSIDVGNLFLPGGGGGGSTPTYHDEIFNMVPVGFGGIQTYQGSGAKRTDPNGTTYAYQGRFSAQYGNMSALFLFDSATIRSALAGATILSSFIYLQNNHFYANAGGTVYIGTHNVDAAPANVLLASPNPGRWSLPMAKGGASWTPDLGAALGNEIRDATTRGIMIGQAPDNNIVYYSFFTVCAVRFIYTK